MTEPEAPAPVTTPAAPEPDPAPAGSEPAGPEPAPTAPGVAPTRSRGARVGRSATQVVAVVGAVVCLALAVVVFLIGSSLTDSIDRALAAGDAAFGRAQATVDEAPSGFRDAIGELDELADRIVESAGEGPLSDAVARRVDAAADRYLEIRDDFRAVRDRVEGAVARVEALDELLPFVDLPDAPDGPLAGFDDRLAEFDTALTSLRGSDVRAAAKAEVLGAVTTVRTAVDQVAGVVGNVQDGVAEVRADVDAAAGTIKTVLWVATFAIIVLLLYVAALHLAILWLIRR